MHQLHVLLWVLSGRRLHWQGSGKLLILLLTVFGLFRFTVCVQSRAGCVAAAVMKDAFCNSLKSGSFADSVLEGKLQMFTSC